MKLEDIKGKEIVQGNVIHIKNFLELILALCDIDIDDNQGSIDDITDNLDIAQIENIEKEKQR